MTIVMSYDVRHKADGVFGRWGDGFKARNKWAKRFFCMPRDEF